MPSTDTRRTSERSTAGRSEVLNTVRTLSTLHHFDNKVDPRPKKGPLIPWERRLARMEIQEFQEVTFETRFGI